jgi:hypothetical protein
MLTISQVLCEVCDRDFGGSEYAMARAWDMRQTTLNRYKNSTRIPGATEYDFLAEKLKRPIAEVHELCMAERRQKELATSSAQTATPATA